MRRFAPLWVYSTAFALAAIAGSINAVTWLGVEHKGVTHVTGAITEAGTQLAANSGVAAVSSIAVVFAFGLGAVLSGLIIADSTLKLGRRYGVGLMVESGLLLAAYVAARAEQIFWADCLAAAACGLQNALATGFSGAVLRTTHMTGVVTDLGQLIGHAIRTRTFDAWRAWVYTSLLGGFSTGAVLGAIGNAHLGKAALLVPAALLFVGGLGYWIWRHRTAHHRHEPAHAPSHGHTGAPERGPGDPSL